MKDSERHQKTGERRLLASIAQQNTDENYTNRKKIDTEHLLKLIRLPS